MNSLICCGTYDLVLDASHRIRLPGEVREQVGAGEGTFIFVGQNRKLWLFPEWAWRTAEANAEARERMQSLEVVQVRVDGRGRILVPRKWLQEMAVGREVMLVGVFDHWELWNRAEWYAHTEDVDARLASIIESSARPLR